MNRHFISKLDTDFDLERFIQSRYTHIQNTFNFPVCMQKFYNDRIPYTNGRHTYASLKVKSKLTKKYKQLSFIENAHRYK